MRILLIISILNTILWSNNSCNLDTSVIMKKLEKKYAKEIEGKDFKPQYNRVPSVVYQKSPSAKSAILILPYLQEDRTDSNSDYYYLSLIITVFDSKTKKIQQSYFHENIAHSEDTWFIKDINVLQNIHPFSVGLEIVRKGASSVFIQWSKTLFLYEKKGKALNPIFSGFIHESLDANHDIDYEEGKHETFKIKPKKSSMAYPPLLFTHEYEYFNSGESWKVELDPVTFVFKNGTYKQKNANNGVVFDLKKIEANVKKGLRYKTQVLKAMLHEVPLSKKNLNHYNDIAYYLQKSRHNKEAIFLLEAILSEFPNRMVAYLNLGDGYWEEAETSSAVTNYKHYIKRMKEKYKEKKIPSYVLVRVAEAKDFSKGFVKKYTKIDTLPPIFLEKMNGTKPLEIVPWMQKKIMRVDREDGLLIHVLAYEKEDDVEFVYFVQSRRDERIDSQFVKGDITMYKFSYKNQTNIFITRFPTRILTSDKGVEGTTLDGWNIFNRQEFILDNGYLYFKESRCVDKHNSFCYEYKYKFGDNKVSKATEYSTKNWYKRWNHKHDTFIYDGDSFDIGHMEDGKKVMKSLFTIKSLKDKNIRGETIPFTIGGTSWSEDDKNLYFDNHDIALACIWRYNLETKELSKIVPEHEAEHPFAFSYKGKEYVAYIEGQDIKVATESKKGKR